MAHKRILCWVCTHVSFITHLIISVVENLAGAAPVLFPETLKIFAWTSGGAKNITDWPWPSFRILMQAVRGD